MRIESVKIFYKHVYGKADIIIIQYDHRPFVSVTRGQEFLIIPNGDTVILWHTMDAECYDWHFVSPVLFY